MSFQMFVPTRALFGAGQLNNLHEQKMPGKKALLVISKGKSTRSNGSLDRTAEQLTKAGVDYILFDQVEPNPLTTTVMKGGALARESGCDFVVALGGGSVMDTSKAIAVVASNEGNIWDYICAGTGKGKAITKDPLPVIAITTTAGTGSETDSGGVVTNPDTNEKIPIADERLFPVISIIDPELMRTIPPDYTAFQGFDALLQSAEAFISNKSSLMSDMCAITSIEHVGRNLARAVRDGNDLEAREKVAFGNYLSGLSMSIAACTSEHGLEHAMSAFHQELPHGAGLIMISKAYFTHFIGKHVCDGRFIRMAKAMGMEEAADPMDFIKTLEKLQEDCGVADLKMSDYGISTEEFDALYTNALDTMGEFFQCDRIPLSKEDCIKIYKKSYK
jgi:Alcohol dehydrogenase, class IV